MNKVSFFCRILLGLIFIVFGSNGLSMILTGSGFLPNPPSNDLMDQVMSGFFATGYLMTTVKALQVMSGLMLLFGRFVNLAVVVLAPIIFNITAIHFFVKPEGLPIAIALCILWLGVVCSRWRDLRVVFRA